MIPSDPICSLTAQNLLILDGKTSSCWDARFLLTIVTSSIFEILRTSVFTFTIVGPSLPVFAIMHFWIVSGRVSDSILSRLSRYDWVTMRIRFFVYSGRWCLEHPRQMDQNFRFYLIEFSQVGGIQSRVHKWCQQLYISEFVTSSMGMANLDKSRWLSKIRWTLECCNLIASLIRSLRAPAESLTWPPARSLKSVARNIVEVSRIMGSNFCCQFSTRRGWIHQLRFSVHLTLASKDALRWAWRSSRWRRGVDLILARGLQMKL